MCLPVLNRSLFTIVLGMDVILKMLSIVEANYPEALKQCYVVNGKFH